MASVEFEGMSNTLEKNIAKKLSMTSADVMSPGMHATESTGWKKKQHDRIYAWATATHRSHDVFKPGYDLDLRPISKLKFLGQTAYLSMLLDERKTTAK